jgi:hypothetical protein
MADSEKSNMKNHEKSDIITFPQTPREATILVDLLTPPPIIRSVANMKNHEKSDIITFPQTPREATILDLLTSPPIIRSVAADTAVLDKHNEDIVSQILAFPFITDEIQQERDIKGMSRSKTQEQNLDDSMIPLPRIKLRPRESTILDLLTPPPIIRDAAAADHALLDQNNQDIVPQILAFPFITEETQQEWDKGMLRSKTQEQNLDDSMIPLPRIKLRPKMGGNVCSCLDKKEKTPL